MGVSGESVAGVRADAAAAGAGGAGVVSVAAVVGTTGAQEQPMLMNDSLRLLLQHIVDNDGHGGYPSCVTHSINDGLARGFLVIEYIGGL